MTLADEVERLRETQKEGVYWDFKQEHHNNKTDLLHDILCLANAEHDGDRYLIFGVEDGSMNLHDLKNDSNRRTQANILTFLKDNQSKFAEGHYPDVHLEKVTIGGSEIDVLIVSASVQKPFYLVEKIDGVKPHHIYTRTGDTNTPKDKSASPRQIEQMWRTQFGLDQSSTKRVKTFLADFDDWDFDTHNSGNGIWWHKVFPEFTIRVEESNFDCTQEWTRGEIVKDRNFSSLYSVYHHQTRLAQIHWVSFDDHKKSMVAPKWKPCSTGRFYYYEQGSIEFSMQLFHAHHNGEDHSKLLKSPDMTTEINLVSADELERFLKTQTAHKITEVCRDPTEQYEIFLKNQLAFTDWKNGCAMTT